MPLLQAQTISHQFDNGDTLFKQLSFVMTARRVGLVGRNGAGKSILAAILSGKITPTSGKVSVTTSLGVFRQQSQHTLADSVSIAQYLDTAEVLSALDSIAAGDCSAHNFDIVGEQWELAAQLALQLSELGLPCDPHFSCAQLSGGQWARLQLYKLFNSNAQLLILDEPSNHLDIHAKQWLKANIAKFAGSVLLISHDRFLLDDMQEIWQLSTQGLQVFGGNYNAYVTQRNIEAHAIERQLLSINKHKKQHQEQMQRNREKAEQRAKQGNKLRKTGSQAKTLLDFKANKAGANSGQRVKHAQQKDAQLKEQVHELQKRQATIQPQAMHLGASNSGAKRVINMQEGVLAFGSQKALSFTIYADEKVRVVGKNGCGKSTFFKALLGVHNLQHGDLRVNSDFYYLDQHFAAIKEQHTLLENLMQQCQGMSQSKARTLLAGVGFRGERVFRQGKMLSGGEKMKLTMLIASHQPKRPVLLLDEPDNFLDLESKIMLAQALRDYGGGYLLISHDSDFANEAGVTREIEL